MTLRLGRAHTEHFEGVAFAGARPQSSAIEPLPWRNDMSTAAAVANPFPGYSLGTIDDQIVNPELYQSEKIHDVYAKLRREDPVHWTAPVGFRPFWSVTKH